MSLTTEELLALLDDIESDRAERKRDWSGDAPKKVREAVCAMSNDLPGRGLPGVVIIGAIDKDGRPSGIDIDDRFLQTLSDVKTDGKILPPPTMTVEKRVLRGAPMAVMTVWPADAPPVRFDGRIWIRVGPRRAIASAQDERILNERRRHLDRPYDTRPIDGCPLSELDRAFFESEYLPQAVASDVLEANERSYQERLASTGMIASADESVPTGCGVLALGKSPRSWVAGSYVQFVRLRGVDWDAPVVDEQEIDGTLDAILRRIDDKCKATLASAVDYTSGTTTESRSTAYPLTALQQVLRNAVMHRTYEGTNEPVRLRWFDDRIEIQSSGGAFGLVTPENFASGHSTDYRNPRIATVLKNLGFVQRFGSGISLTRSALERNGNPPPEFVAESSSVLVTLRARP